jgi:hypothetical protein
MKIYVDIDNTICITNGSDYEKSIPLKENIEKINELCRKGHEIIYWTGRGGRTGINHKILTIKQLNEWGCEYERVILGEKPDFDLLIDDKTIRIEEL